MTCSKSLVSVAFVAAVSLVAASPVQAQHRGGGGVRGGGGAVVRGGGGAVVRGGGVVVGRPGVVAPRVIAPRIVGYGVYHPYYYYRPGISIGFYAGFGYPYYYGYYGYPYGYPYYSPYPYAYPYPYPAYSYPSYSYPGYGYGQPGYAAPQPQTGVSVQPQGSAYGGVRIEGGPHDAPVYVDGHYAGIVDDFDGGNKHLNLTAGVHQVEIRLNGQQPVAFDVNVPPNQTVTVRMP
jgi:hypothetical protein